MTIFAFFISAAISFFLVFIGQTEPVDLTLGLSKTLGATVNQVS